ncbi:MAG: hypothetical protein Q9M91_01265 [Candidatus Dojkabacteria bacterium]|nr:hypothetical protein [Candidatus Dojkabacteria bacterium]MDQ7020453.1 hypothetical protein [Candidatus Dojkabacteria bacterium]
MATNTFSFSEKKFKEFNLVPPISKEEIKVIEKRDTTIIYSFILLFSAALMYFSLSMYQAIRVTPKIDSLENEISQIENEIGLNQDVVILNGELITKGNILLKPILANDIKLREIIDLSNDIALGNSIVDYALEDRESLMVIVVTLDNIDQVIEVYRNSLVNENIKDVSIRSVKFRNDPERIDLELEFRFNLI